MTTGYNIRPSRKTRDFCFFEFKQTKATMELVATNPNFRRHDLQAIVVSNARESVKLSHSLHCINYDKRMFTSEHNATWRMLTERSAKMNAELAIIRERKSAEEQRRRDSRNKAELEREKLRAARARRQQDDLDTIPVLRKLIAVAMTHSDANDDSEPETPTTASDTGRERFVSHHRDSISESRPTDTHGLSRMSNRKPPSESSHSVSSSVAAVPPKIVVGDDSRKVPASLGGRPSNEQRKQTGGPGGGTGGAAAAAAAPTRTRKKSESSSIISLHIGDTPGFTSGTDSAMASHGIDFSHTLAAAESSSHRKAVNKQLEGLVDKIFDDCGAVAGNSGSDSADVFGVGAAIDSLHPEVADLEPHAQRKSSAKVDKATVIRRLRPIVTRALRLQAELNAAASLAAAETGFEDSGTGLHHHHLQQLHQRRLPDLGNDDSERLQALKRILNEQFGAILEMEEKTTEQMKNREKKLWSRFNPTPAVFQPIFQHKKIKFLSRYWDFEAVTPAAPPITDDDWEELHYCRYLRPAVVRSRRQEMALTL